jgi:hypothetical protein
MSDVMNVVAKWVGILVVLGGVLWVGALLFRAAVEECAQPLVQRVEGYLREAVSDVRHALYDRIADVRHDLTDALASVKKVVNTNAEQHNKLASLVEEVVAEVREAGVQTCQELRKTAAEREAAHLAGVKGHVDQVKRDVTRLEGAISTLPATSWVRRLESELESLRQRVLGNGLTAGMLTTASRVETQQNADRLRIEKLEAQLASLANSFGDFRHETERAFGMLGEDIATLADAVRALQAPATLAKAKKATKKATRRVDK